MQQHGFLPLHGSHEMPSDRTRTAILEAAERLYADRGFADVTLRDIVAAADVNLAAVNYHFGSKDELIAELFVTRSLALNRERLSELRAAEDRGGGRADITEVLRALVGPSLRGCLGPDRQRSAAARFMIRASIESVPPIRDSERLTKLSEGTCDLNDVDAVVERVVAVAVMAVIGDGAQRNIGEAIGARRMR
jgi:AcrR family transcriptional regulator